MESSGFQENVFVIKRKILALLHTHFIVSKPTGEPLYSCMMKAFKLKEDIRVHDAHPPESEVLCIQARQIIDFSAAYDVVDSQTRQRLGALRRKGFHSMFRDTWEVLNNNDDVIGQLTEDSLFRALLRRLLLGWLFPQHFHLMAGNECLCRIRQHFNPFRFTMTAEITPEGSARLDRRIVLAAALLLSAIEGRQN